MSPTQPPSPLKGQYFTSVVLATAVYLLTLLFLVDDMLCLVSFFSFAHPCSSCLTVSMVVKPVHVSALLMLVDDLPNTCVCSLVHVAYGMLCSLPDCQILCIKLRSALTRRFPSLPDCLRVHAQTCAPSASIPSLPCATVAPLSPASPPLSLSSSAWCQRMGAPGAYSPQTESSTCLAPVGQRRHRICLGHLQVGSSAAKTGSTGMCFLPFFCTGCAALVPCRNAHGHALYLGRSSADDHNDL